MLPKRSRIKGALLEYLQTGSKTTSECYEYLALTLDLSEEALAMKTSNGESKFQKEIRWAKKDLLDEGLLKGSMEVGRGRWELKEDELSPLLYESAEELDRHIKAIGEVRCKPKGQLEPKKGLTARSDFIRDARVVHYVLQEANGICECCDRESPFLKNNGVPYLEVHHLKRLSRNGSDRVTNAVGVCPNCHRELHYGVEAEELMERIYSKVSRLVRE